jgi:thymidine kinase
MHEFMQSVGQLEVICGPMFSGKSEELIRRLRRVELSGKEFLLFKPNLDNRYEVDSVVSHDARKLKAIATGVDKNGLQVIETIASKFPDAGVIGFDEVHLYDPHVTELIEKWVAKGKRVIAAGLDTDFRGKPFGCMPQLLCAADYVDKLKAICAKCKTNPATMSQRMSDGKPARYSDPVVLGSSENYEARCRKCHQVIKGQDVSLDKVL